jgi:FtsP/CotA-like multicopper oxidase with cupredoxin domain
MRRVLFWVALFCVAVSTTFAQSPAPKATQASAEGKVRTYYVAADEVEWDYAPGGVDHMTGQPFDKYASIFIERGPHRIGSKYRKAIYREYTDATFGKLKPRAPEWEHMGLMGSLLRAEVGDTIKVVFKNNASKPYTMHPHGVFYLKNSEGAPYADGTAGADKADDDVPPGGTHTYIWNVPERAGPAPGDPSSVVWLYHSHRNEPKDVNSGLVGAIVVSARGKARPDGSPKDVDREFVTLFMVFDENQTWYLDHNIETYTTDPKGVNKGELFPVDIDGASSLFVGGGFGTVNHKFSINGYLFGNMPMMTMKKGERVRWYLLSLGDGFNFHTPHWHGNVVLQDHKRTDVVTLMPAQMVTVDMVPDNPGMWMFHCHVSDHLIGGMHAHFQVLP